MPVNPISNGDHQCGVGYTHPILPNNPFQNGDCPNVPIPPWLRSLIENTLIESGHRDRMLILSSRGGNRGVLRLREQWLDNCPEDVA